MSEFRPQLLAAEFSLFLVVQLLGLWVGWTIIRTVAPPKMEAGPAVFWFLIAFAIATGVILLALKFFKFKAPFGIVFAFLIFFGSDIVFSTFLPGIVSFICALGVVALRFVWPNILTQNIAIILAVAGVSAMLGAQLPVIAVIVLLLVLSVYDFWAVFKTKHMVELAKGLIQRGMAPMIVMPTSWKDFTRSMEAVQTEKLKPHKVRAMKYMMLGTGDLAFPLVFAVSALSYGLLQAYAVIAGALAGIAVIHYILMTNKKIHALPALPPIAAGSIIAFAVSLLI